MAQSVANPEDGLRAVDLGGERTFAALCIEVCYADKATIAHLARSNSRMVSPTMVLNFVGRG